MKKLLLILLLTFTGQAQCTLCENLSTCFGEYRPGVYIGGQLGGSWIHFPKRKHALENTPRIERGYFALGTYAGFTLLKAYNLLIGFEGGYNNNGFTNFHFPSQNKYRISFQDWNLSGTFFYPINCYRPFFKIGGACVWEELKHFRRTCGCITPFRNIVLNRTWAPVINTGVGYAFGDSFEVTLAYRGVFCRSHGNNFFLATIPEVDRNYFFHWRGISSINSLYLSANLYF
jgi:OmpA-like transmembrane domain